MKLVIGGSFQGKTNYALECFGISKEQAVDGMKCGFEEIYNAGMIYHFHEYLKRMLEDGQEVTTLAETVIRRNPELIVVSNELGYGIVPVDAFDRKYREATGRICCRLAKEADEVHRVVCGIGMVIKHA